MKKLLLLICILFSLYTNAQQNNLPTPKVFTSEQDHANMMEQLGIKKLRTGPSGNEADLNHANYDEKLANPYPNLPEVLVLKNGQKVTTSSMWWHARRAEIVEEMDREVFGRVPSNIPSVSWKTVLTDNEIVSRVPVIAKQLIGHVDNTAYPLIDVNIEMTLVLPANTKGPVPVLMMFGFGKVPAPSQPNLVDLAKMNEAFKKLLETADPSLKEIFNQHQAYQPILPAPGYNPFAAFAPPPPPVIPNGPVDVPGVLGVNIDPSSVEQLIANGWGYAIVNPASIQADNGAGLTRGIIGLVNKGQPRKPDDWGALRAWSWGAARAFDYLEKFEPTVDSKHIGIEGVSRYGKAALVTMAYETKFAMALVGSSGQGGAKLSRRNFGEAVESLTGSGEYHWMAGNYLKYGAAEAIFGMRTANDLPVDAHELIALCAPRLTFISYGVPEKGDAKWLDQQGSYMATVAAGKVFRLLGAKDLGVSDNYNAETMPPVNTSMLDGQLAWRQHDQGHQDQANMKWFLKWANKNMDRK